MSQMNLTRKVVADLRNGFYAFASAKVKASQRKGRKTICDVQDRDSNLRIVLGLNHKNKMQVWFYSDHGEGSLSKPVPQQEFIEQFVPIGWGVKWHSESTSLTLYLSVNKRDYTTIKQYQLSKWELSADMSIGATVDNKEQASFNLKTLSVYTRDLSEKERQNLVNIFADF